MTQEIKGRDCLKIRETSWVRDYDKSSKMAGKQYRIFSYQGKGFSVETNDSFIEEFKKGNIFSVEFDTNEEGQLSLLSFSTHAQERKAAMTEGLLAQYEKGNFDFSKVSPEDIIS